MAAKAATNTILVLAAVALEDNYSLTVDKLTPMVMADYVMAMVRGRMMLEHS